MKEKMEDESKGNFIVTIETLEDIMEESIRIFWEFVKADKDETSGFLKMLIGSHAELEDPADSKLMSEIQIKLEKVVYHSSLNLVCKLTEAIHSVPCIL